MARHPGVRLSFEAAVSVAKERFEYWTRRDETSTYCAWCGDRWLGAARTQAGADNLIVRDFARQLGAESGA